MDEDKKYIVLVSFADKHDGNRRYDVGDPYVGSQDPARIEELATSNNAYGYPFIALEE